MSSSKRNYAAILPQDPAFSKRSTKGNRKPRSSNRSVLSNSGRKERPSKDMKDFLDDLSVKEAMRARAEAYHKRINRIHQGITAMRGQPPPNPKDSMTEEEFHTYERKEQIIKAIFEPQVENVKALYQPPVGFQTMLCGAGDSFQLGSLDSGKKSRSGDDAHTDSSRLFRPNRNLRMLPIIKVVCGGLHNLALHADGRRLYSWGVNDQGPLGRTVSTTEKEAEYTAALVDTPPNMGHIVKIGAGDCHSIAITLDGKVWSWGAYRDREAKEFCDVEERGPDSYKLMQGSKIIGQKIRHSKPTQVHMPPGTFVEDVAAGEAFNVVRTSGMDLLTWGYSEVGETGRPPAKVRDEEGNYDQDLVLQEWLTPRPPTWADGRARKVQAVGCGGNHLLVIARAGEDCATTSVYSCGLNNYGQLGHGDSGGDTHRHSLTRIQDLDNLGIRKVAAGTHHSICSDVNGNLFAFGRADRLQLGIHTGTPGDASAEFFTKTGFFVDHPVRVDFEDDEKVTDIACGGSHCLAMTKSGNLYTWGSGEGGMLGLGREKDEGRPRKVNLSRFAPSGRRDAQIKVFSIDGGGQHSAITCTIAV